MSKDRNMPVHVAIIMDGNGRWAKQQGKERVYGHMNGVESVREIVKCSLKNDIKYLTLYTFSSENWGRPAEEVNALMDIFCEGLIKEVPELKKRGVALHVIGNIDAMPDRVREYMNMAKEQTCEQSKLTIIFALNYGSRDEITMAMRKIAERVKNGEINAEDITAESISSHLYTSTYPDPDLLIRTGGEQRLSNFLLWQSAYTEFYFTPTFWPDFREEEFEKALDSYLGRDRRYGVIIQ